MDFNKYLESINQNISEALYRSNQEGLVYVNRAYAQMFGFQNEEEALNSPTAKFYEDLERRTSLINLLKKEGKYQNEEVTFFKKDGSKFIGLVSAVLFESNDGEVFWDGSIRDITSYREIINKLLDKDQLLQSINKSINEAIYRSRKNGGLVYVNDEFVRMFGYDSAEDLLKHDVSDLYKNPSDRDDIGDAIVEHDSLSNEEVEFRRKDGSTFWGYLNSITVKGQDGQIYFDGAIRDISKEKEADFQSQRQAEMQELLIYISSGLINVPTEEIDEAVKLCLHGMGVFVHADRSYIFEFKEDHSSVGVHSWIRKGIAPIQGSHPQSKLAFEEISAILNKDKKLVSDEVDKMDKGILRNIFLEQEIKTVLNIPLLKDGECIGCVGFDWVRGKHKVSSVEVLLLRLFADMYVNIQERSKKEKEFRKLFDKTVEQNQRLKDFSYITSHNFRSSVANLMGLITILEEDRTNDEFFVMMKETALKLNLAIDSINDLLNFEKDITALEKEDCNLNQIVSDIIVLNKKDARDKNINFKIDVPKDLTVKVLPAYLQSVIHNLITNAMKYGITAEKRNIFVTAKKDVKNIVVSVRDEGVGIDMEKYGDKLFRLGSRFHASMDSGHGMGLYITKQQVEAIGGHIEVESQVNKGTTFKIYLNG